MTHSNDPNMLIAVTTFLIAIGIIIFFRLRRSHFAVTSYGSKYVVPRSHLMSLQHATPERPMRVIVAITGATGAALAIRLLEKLRVLGVETHLVMSHWAGETIKFETGHKIREVNELASKHYAAHDVSATLSSGSFPVDAMIVVPCSMKTLSAIRTGYGSDLITRAADVTLKEQRKLVLVVRETPLSVIHLENMLELAKQRVVIFPPVPAYYIQPESFDDVIEQSVNRMLDALGLDGKMTNRWEGLHKHNHDGVGHET